jgi:hypothetical protein
MEKKREKDAVIFDPESRAARDTRPLSSDQIRACEMTLTPSDGKARTAITTDIAQNCTPTNLHVASTCQALK